MMEATEYPFHKGARTSLYVAAGLCILLVCAAPIGAYFIWRVMKGKVIIDSQKIRAEGMLTDEIVFSDVERVGLLRIPMVAGGIGGMLARMKLNNMDHGINLVARLNNGKDVKFLLNQYENHEQIIERVKQALPTKQLEEIPMGMLTWKWPERAA
ncbi:MAG: hypothetical protein JNK82_19500 [Myxococcaceae bacterium]|nr:hypothetical protein [Myxococcaceae bacterium]